MGHEQSSPRKEKQAHMSKLKGNGVLGRGETGRGLGQ